MALRDLPTRLLTTAATAKEVADRAVLVAKRELSLMRPQEARPYLGHGTPRSVHVKGRVREDPGVGPPRPSDGALDNVRATVRRFTATPVPDARVRVAIGDTAVEVRSDADGWFRADLHPSAPLPPGWHEVQATLVASPVPGPVAPTAVSAVLVPPADASFGIVSDLDDTVIRSGLTTPLRAVATVLLHNAATRSPFPGVAAFYRALQAGPTGAQRNPLFYVSSGPWNLYDLITTFLDLRGIPRGPLFLRAWGFDRDALPSGGHATHKLSVVLSLFDLYPDLPFVLIGDSGQHDPEIYRDVVLARPGRVRAVYVRDVTEEGRDEAVRAVAQQVRAAGVPFEFAPDTTAVARSALALGLLAPEALEQVAAAATR